ncbi:DUF554 domain-containing protein [Paenibacillus sp. FSL R5-0527]|uniref:DUF554 domain-containing protein n=1 Tax=Paenibacillus TaxID=44249 RepID=UPI000979F9C9|nr:DUF554 domain-containing protein [Paenibacillus macerans]OMG46186.1 hypothetical protein BK140_28310 [Paenibacillus macerans]
MIGTLVNVGAIIAGSLIGSIFKKGLSEKYQAALFTAIGFAATVLGINAVVTNMKNSVFPVLFIISLAVGSLIGTALDIDGRFQRLVGRFSTSNLGQGLSTGILLFCIGTLSILGPIESAIRGDHTYLFMNATLDLVTSMVLASSYGLGIILTAVVLFLWQGAIYMSADYLAPFLTADLLTEVSIVGGVLIASSGLSILKIKESKTLNMLPSLLVPVVWFLIKGWIG